MNHSRFLALPILLGGLALPAAAQGIGSKLPKLELADLSQTTAKSYEDFQGRTVLIEFFAYW